MEFIVCDTINLVVNSTNYSYTSVARMENDKLQLGVLEEEKSAVTNESPEQKSTRLQVNDITYPQLYSHAQFNS